MNFDTTSLIVAFPASEMAQIEAHREQYGADLPESAKPGAVTVNTLLGHMDGVSGILRAGMAPSTVSARTLTDGRYAVAGYWSMALKAAWEAGNIQAEILTPEQLNELTPEPEL